MKTPFSLAASFRFFFGTKVGNSWNGRYLSILLHFAPIGEKFFLNLHSFMKYRTILIALSAFLNSNQMSSNLINTFGGPALSLEVLLALQSPELASKCGKQDLPSPLPRPSCTGYSFSATSMKNWTSRMENLSWPSASLHPMPSSGVATWSEFIPQLLMEPGRRVGHLSHCACYCKDSEPEAVKACHMERACLREAKTKGSTVEKWSKTESGDSLQSEASTSWSFFSSMSQRVCNSTPTNLFSLNQFELILSLEWRVLYQLRCL